MQIDQAAILNERMGTLPDVYYYSVPCSYTKKSGDSYVPKKGMEPFFVMRSYQIGQYTGMTKRGVQGSVRNGRKMTEGSVPFPNLRHSEH